MNRLRGQVVRLSLRRLKNGELRHDTRIEFTEDSYPFSNVRVQGRLADIGGNWSGELLMALGTRYELIGPPYLPEPRWAANSHD